MKHIIWRFKVPLLLLLFLVNGPPSSTCAYSLAHAHQTPSVAAQSQTVSDSANANAGARLALSALKSLAFVSVHISRFGIVTEFDSSLGDEANAIRILADLPKPVRCKAAVAEKTLWITCTAIADEDDAFELTTRLRHLRDHTGVVGSLRSELASPANDRVLVVVDTVRLLANVADLEEWYQDYLLGPTLLLSSRPVDERDGSEAGYAVEMGPNEEIPPELLPTIELLKEWHRRSGPPSGASQ